MLQRNGAVKLARSMNAVKVPATVQAVLASRIDRLSAEEKELLQTLAVRDENFRNHRWAEWVPQGARVGWLDGQDLFLDMDSAYRAAKAMAADGDGIVVGVQTLLRRLHESDRLKSIDERRGKLKVHRILCGSRLEVLHLPADVLEHSVGETGPIGPSTDAKDDLPGSHDVGGFALVSGVD